MVADGETGPSCVLTYHAEELGESVGVLLLLATAARVLSITRQQWNYWCHHRDSVDAD